MRTETTLQWTVRCAVALFVAFGGASALFAENGAQAPSHVTEDTPAASPGRVRPRVDGSVEPSVGSNDAWTGEFLQGDDLVRQLEHAMRDVGLLETPATGEKEASKEATLAKNQRRPGLEEKKTEFAELGL